MASLLLGLSILIAMTSVVEQQHQWLQKVSEFFDYCQKCSSEEDNNARLCLKVEVELFCKGSATFTSEQECVSHVTNNLTTNNRFNASSGVQLDTQQTTNNTQLSGEFRSFVAEQMKLECFVEAYADWFAGQLTTAKLSATAITTPEHIATLISRTLSTRNNMPRYSRRYLSELFALAIDRSLSSRQDVKRLATAALIYHHHYYYNYNTQQQQAPKRLCANKSGAAKRAEAAAAATSNIIKIFKAQKYGFGTFAILFVSVIALLGIVLLLCFDKYFYQNVRHTLSTLAASTLFCNATLRILPEVILSKQIEATTGSYTADEFIVAEHIGKIVLVIAALYVFLLFEIVVHRFAGSQSDQHSQSDHSHQTTMPDLVEGPFVVEEATVAARRPSKKELYADQSASCLARIDVRKVRASGWIILLGDAIHKFANGMAVGASFSQSIGMGVGTTIAVVCHEIPHELGNYAVLIKCGFTHWQALVFNLISASTCIIGFFICVSIAGDPEVSRWIFAITAGMFLYISLVDLFPSILSDDKWGWTKFLVSNAALWAGFLIMFLLVVFEDHITNLVSGSVGI